MQPLALVFPHQLFADHPAISPGCDVALIEDSLFFRDEQYPARFHKQRLILHRASMRRYADGLRTKGHKVRYVEWAHVRPLGKVVETFANAGYKTLRLADPTDFMVAKRLGLAAERLGLSVEVLDTPMFFNTEKDNAAFFKGRKRWHMADFYKHQRRDLGVLIQSDGEPVGGQWSFDAENRRKLTPDALAQVPPLPTVEEDDYVREARSYVEQHFADHYGDAGPLLYPTDHTGAQAWLDAFVDQRLQQFGPFEDAFEAGQPFLYHAALTPMLNTGLLTPVQVLDAVLQGAQDRMGDPMHEIPLSSLEGFVRQIIGWREYMRASYVAHGVTMRNANQWEQTRDVPESLYDGTTGIAPVDDVIRRLNRFAYAHHIERLMVMGSFCYVACIHPDAAYRWFMEMHIDAYDWVMVPNVYGMSQHAAGPIITTKPYFGGSNYIRKMSRWGKGPWADEWDGLFWRMVATHRDALGRYNRLGMMLRLLDKMKPDRLAHLDAAADALVRRLWPDEQ